MSYIKNPGVYVISNKVNGKSYIGSSNTIQRRWGEHLSRLRGNTHENEYLQNAWNKYGEENFEFTVLENCTEDKLLEVETYWLAKYETTNRDKGYNIREADRHKHSQETKDKLSKIHTGKKLSDETKRKLSEINTGRGNPHTEESKAKISKAKKGKPLSEAHRLALSESHKGKKWTDKQREARKGKTKKVSPDTVRQIRKSKEEGKTYKEISILYDISERTAFDIVKRKYHKDVF